MGDCAGIAGSYTKRQGIRLLEGAPCCSPLKTAMIIDWGFEEWGSSALVGTRLPEPLLSWQLPV